MGLLIQLRWIAIVGQVLTIAFVALVLRARLPLAPMGLVLCGLMWLNLASIAWLRSDVSVREGWLFGVMLLDVAALAVQVSLSGGVTNPFTFLFLLQVTLGAVLLPALLAWAIAAATGSALGLVTLFYQPLALPADLRVDRFELYLIGMALCFGLDAALLVVFITRVNRNLRARDVRLAELRQHAAEEDHLVRMGLLATGAAHELGTPLSLLAVILNDWQRMPAIARDDDLALEVGEMQEAVLRCKTIVTGILNSFGEARGEAPRVVAAGVFVDEVIADWRAGRSVGRFDYRRPATLDGLILADTAVKQAICNVLDNALEASPDFVSCAASIAEDELVVVIADAGPGFPAPMLERFGKPYQSSKGRAGSGLGLFLVVNVLRKLGGTVSARNRAEGGAAVTLRLKLANAVAEGGDG